MICLVRMAFIYSLLSTLSPSFSHDGSIRLWDIHAILRFHQANLTSPPSYKPITDGITPTSFRFTSSNEPGAPEFSVQNTLASQNRFLLNTFFTRSTSVLNLQPVSEDCITAVGVYVDTDQFSTSTEQL